MANPIPQTIGMRFIYLRDRNIDIKTFVQLFFRILWRKNNTNGKYIIYFLKRNILRLHLVPDRIWRFHSRHNLVVYAHFIQLSTDRGSKITENLITGCCRILQFFFYLFVFFRMFILKTQIFQFRFYLIKSQPIGQRSIYIESLSCYLVLLIGKHRSQSTHIMKAVGYFD